MAKVYAPNKRYNGESASVQFREGVGETDNPRLLEWFETHGYRIDEPGEEKPPADVPVEEMSINQLRAYAKENKIELGVATKKIDMVAVIVAAQQNKE